MCCRGTSRPRRGSGKRSSGLSSARSRLRRTCTESRGAGLQESSARQCRGGSSGCGSASRTGWSSPVGSETAAPADRDVTYGEAVPDATVDRLGDSDQPIDDTWITTKVKSSLLADSDVSGLEIEVETVNGVVTLSGDVDEQVQIERATQIARDIEGVTEVRTRALVVDPDGDR
ncbi:MAG: BON domain-containing protein [Gammaproteobacteria bacterium]|nr:BON domain-containing protein [Gammaproteobacteria bacterium]